MKTEMKYGMIIVLMIAAGFNIGFGAEQSVQPQNDTDQIQLPPKNTPQYWNVRSEAISELLPLLTKKRAEIKAKQQTLVAYLEDNGMASDFASKNIAVPNDPNIYFTILQIGQGLEDMNMPKPTKRPSWDEIMDVAMEHVVFEGYLPTHTEEGEDLEQYVQICRQKEQYGQKVRQDLRPPLDQCARMWVYLSSVKKIDDFKSYYADQQLEQENQRAQAKAQVTEEHRQAMMQQAAAKEGQEFQDAQAREQFSSGQREQRYNDRQTRLQDRASNRGINYYY